MAHHSRMDRPITADLTALLRDRGGAGHRLDAGDRDRFLGVRALLGDPPASLLDVGCGTGVLTDWLAGLGFDATGVDIDSELMLQMRSPHSEASIESLPFTDGSFDFVVASEVLEHLPEPMFGAAISELGRVARSGIVVSVPNEESLESASTRCPACGCVYSIHGHVRRFDVGTLSSLIPGWRLATVEEAGPWKARHRSVEWFVRRRALGRWPSAPGTACPQCLHEQVAADGRSERSGTFGRAARMLVAAPWRHRWWLVARYEPG